MKPTETVFISVEWLNWELYYLERRIPTQNGRIYIFFLLLLKTCRQSIYVQSEKRKKTTKSSFLRGLLLLHLIIHQFCTWRVSVELRKWDWMRSLEGIQRPHSNFPSLLSVLKEKKVQKRFRLIHFKEHCSGRMQLILKGEITWNEKWNTGSLNNNNKKTLYKSCILYIFRAFLSHFPAASITRQVMEIRVIRGSVFRVWSAPLGENKRPATVLNETN